MLGQTSVSPSTVELAQLQILHRARKRKLEEVTNELARKEKEYERQIRVLNHQLALMKGTLSNWLVSFSIPARQLAYNPRLTKKNNFHHLDSFYLGEHDRMASSLKHAQEVATSRKNEMDELERKLQNSDFEKEGMNNERNEVSLSLLHTVHEHMFLEVIFLNSS